MLSYARTLKSQSNPVYPWAHRTERCTTDYTYLWSVKLSSGIRYKKRNHSSQSQAMTISTSNLRYRQLPRSTNRTLIALDLLNTAVRVRPDNHASDPRCCTAIHYCKLLDICPCNTSAQTVLFQSFLHRNVKNVLTLLFLSHFNVSNVISERELKFTFAICHRPSVCRLSVVCRL